MKIKLSKGGPRGNGIFIVSYTNNDEFELVYINDGWVFAYPQYNSSFPIESANIRGWKKIKIEDVLND